MEATLGALLARRGLDLRHLAGPLDRDRRVRWVAVSELPDPTPYLEGGELLLTTGLELPVDDDAAVVDYVERIRRRGVVALGPGTGAARPRPPGARLRGRARRAAAPRGAAPHPVHRGHPRGADLVAQAEREDVTRSLDAHRRLTRAALHEDGPAAVLRELARLVGGWAVVTDGGGDVVHTAGASTPALLDSVAEEVARLAPQGLRGASGVGASGGSLVVHPLGVAGAQRGYLAAGRDGSFTRPDRTAVATSVSLLSLALQRADAAAPSGAGSAARPPPCWPRDGPRRRTPSWPSWGTTRPHPTTTCSCAWPRRPRPTRSRRSRPDSSRCRRVRTWWCWPLPPASTRRSGC